MGYKFRRKQLLDEALTHSSAGSRCSNERLEFLGDSVLGMLVTTKLFDTFPMEREGALSRRRSTLVSNDVLAQAARKLGLPHLLRAQQIYDSKPRVLAATFEAIVGAVYLDSDLSVTRTGDFVERYVLVSSSEPLTNPKSLVVEWSHRTGVHATYSDTDRGATCEAEAHTELRVGTTEQRTVGHGATKRAAQQDAAAQFMLGLGLQSQDT
jgi:ribonuclease-3